MRKTTPTALPSTNLACSRRGFLKLSGISAVGMGSMMFLAGCGPAAQETDDAGSTADDTAATASFGSDGMLRVGMEAAYVPL